MCVSVYDTNPDCKHTSKLSVQHCSIEETKLRQQERRKKEEINYYYLMEQPVEGAQFITNKCIVRLILPICPREKVSKLVLSIH